MQWRVWCGNASMHVLQRWNFNNKSMKREMITYECITEKFLDKISYLFDILKMTVSTLPKLLFLFLDNLTTIKKIAYVCGYANLHYFNFFIFFQIINQYKKLSMLFSLHRCLKKVKIIMFSRHTNTDSLFFCSSQVQEK